MEKEKRRKNLKYTTCVCVLPYYAQIEHNEKHSNVGPCDGGGGFHQLATFNNTIRRRTDSIFFHARCEYVVACVSPCYSSLTEPGWLLNQLKAILWNFFLATANANLFPFLQEKNILEAPLYRLVELNIFCVAMCVHVQHYL